MANLSQVAFKLLTDVLSISHFWGDNDVRLSNSKEIVILVLHRM